MSPDAGDLPEVAWLRAILVRCWSLRTSSKWSAQAPSRGQCGVTALVINDHFGGEIVKTSVGARWHFYNRFAGRRLDLTADQFSTPIEYLDLSSTREEAFADTNRAQYEELSRRFAACLNAAPGRA